MAGKILGIEIGTRMTYVVEMDYKVKTPKIYQFFCIPTPEDVVTDGSVRVVPEFLEQIKFEMTQHGIRTKRAIFVMNSTRIANREVLIPMVKEKQIHDLLITNSSEFFPVDLTQYQLVHNIIEKLEAEKKYKLSVFAVPREIVASYSDFAKALNLEIEALDYVGNSVVQGMIKLMKEPVKVTIKLDENSAMLTLMENDKLQLQRNISYGIEEAVEIVMESGVFGKTESFAEALKIMFENRCVNPEFRGGSRMSVIGADEQELLREDATESMRSLVGNVSRILDYYTSNHQEVAIEQIWLLGMGAHIQGICELFENELNLKVSPVNETTELIISRGVLQRKFYGGEYAVAIAATLNPLAFGIEKEKEKKRLQMGNELFAPGVVCIVCLLAAAALTIAAVIPKIILEREKAELTKKIEALQAAEDIYQEYELTMTEYSKLQEVYQLTQTPDDALLAFLGEMEEKMPSEIIVETMTAGPEGVNMDIKVSEKPVAADVLVKLRAFTTLASVTTQGVTDGKDDAGKNSVRFSVYCRYAGTETAEMPDGNAADNTDVEGAEDNVAADVTTQETGGEIESDNLADVTAQETGDAADMTEEAGGRYENQ